MKSQVTQQPFLAPLREDIGRTQLRGHYSHQLDMWVIDNDSGRPTPFVLQDMSIVATETVTKVHPDPKG